MASFNQRTVAQLLKLEVQCTFDAWEAERPLRTGAPHASTVLQPNGEWCLRRQVLLALHPEEAEQPERKPWDTLRNMRNKHGWMVHEKYQALLKRYGNVVYTNGKPELDLTHFDETRFLYFSPDAITEFGGHRYIWEIKGYKQETWQDMDETGAPPKDAHKQVNLYMHLLDVERGLILVENKNTQELKTWAVEHDAEMARPYTQRCYGVKGSVALARAGKGLPVRACSSCTEHRAEKCPVKKLCFSGRLKEK